MSALGGILQERASEVAAIRDSRKTPGRRYGFWRSEKKGFSHGVLAWFTKSAFLAACGMISAAVSTGRLGIPSGSGIWPT